jgi:hypothetical protein
MVRRKSLWDKLDDLQEIIEELKEDAEKVEEGNKAAGTRVRVGLQDVKKEAQEIRIFILREQKKKKK